MRVRRPDKTRELQAARTAIRCGRSSLGLALDHLNNAAVLTDSKGVDDCATELGRLNGLIDQLERQLRKVAGEEL